VLLSPGIVYDVATTLTVLHPKGAVGRSTTVYMLGAVVLAIGGYFTYRNLRVAQENREETKRKAAAEREASEHWSMQQLHECLSGTHEGHCRVDRLLACPDPPFYDLWLWSCRRWARTNNVKWSGNRLA